MDWKTAWVTGASSGIGRELALLLARNGVRVAVTARSADKLGELCKLAPGLLAAPADVTDPAALKAAYERLRAELGVPDLAVLNAGVWDPMGAGDYTAERAHHSMQVNYLGIANCLELLMPDMIARKQGRITLVASVAGYRGLPKAAAYAPSKAAVISLAEVLKTDLARHGVGVSLVNPGFVETPMTKVNTFPMPYMITAEDAARRIVRGLEQGKFEIAFPWQLAGMLKFARVLPYRWYFWFVTRFVAKG